MNFINSILSENLINAIGWTIIHSLWQGAAAALLFALVMFFLRRLGARTRYLVGVMALMLILAISAVTFVSIYQPGMSGTPITGENGSRLVMTGTAEIQGNVTLTAFFKNYFSRHLPLVVTLWLSGVLVLVLRLAGGYLYNQRLKLHRNRLLPDSWQNRLQAFCGQTGIRKSIKLVESALVKVPMTIGHFKPVILFPLGLVTGLPRDQVEALLAHELAHILRRDYLVNILQSFVDILFFYHPGVRWISSQVRMERENCCDDIAVSLSGDSLNVARALTNIQGYDVRTPVPAMAAAGKSPGSHGLLARIKRLVSPPAKGSSVAAGTIGAVILVMGLLILMISTNAAAALSLDSVYEENPAQEAIQPVEEEKDKKEELEKKEKEELIKLESKLKAEKMLMEKMHQELQNKEKEARQQKSELDKEKKEKLKMLEKKLKEQEFKLQQLDNLIKEREIERGEREELRNRERVMREEVRDRERAVREVVRERERAERREEVRQREREIGEEQARVREQDVEMRKEAERMRAQEAEMRKHEEERREQLEAKIRKQEAEFREQQRQLRKQADHLMMVIAKELLQDKLITDPNDYEFQFKKGKLYINGKKQSKAVYKKYKELYEKTSGKKLDESGNFTIIKN